MKLLFLYPNADRELIGAGDMGAIAEPLALEYLAASCEKFVSEMRLLDLRLHPDDLDRVLNEFSPDVVAITGYSMHVIRIIKLTEIIKEYRPRIRTVVGGHHATLLPEDFKKDSIDFIVCGEGTKPFSNLILRLSQEDGVDSIPGVWKKKDNGWIFGGEQGEFVLDEIIRPNREITALDRCSYFIDWMKPIALMRTTVGCPYRCSFCSLWRIMDGQYYKRDMEAVVEELKTISEPYIFLVDDEPFINSKRMDALAELIIESKVNKEYFSYCRIDTLLKNRKTIERWMEAGLRRVFLGIEGVTAKEMSDFNKRLSIIDVERGLKAAREMGLKVFASFIVSPSYTRTDFKQLTRFIERNRIDYPSFTILTPLPGTDAFNSEYKNITEWQKNGRPDWSKWDLQHLVLPSTLSRKDFEREYSLLRKNCKGAYDVYQRKASLELRS